MRSSLILLAIFAASPLMLGAGTAAAQAVVNRTLPPQGKLATTGAPQPMPQIQLDRQVLRLAPGGVIVDQSNRLILPQNLPSNAPALYVLDMHGDIQRLVLLTPEEAKQLKAK